MKRCYKGFLPPIYRAGPLGYRVVYWKQVVRIPCSTKLTQYTLGLVPDMHSTIPRGTRHTQYHAARYLTHMVPDNLVPDIQFPTHPVLDPYGISYAQYHSKRYQTDTVLDSYGT